MKILKNQKGQSATEYMLVIAIVVLGLVAGASQLIPKFREGVDKLSSQVVQTLETTHDMSTGN